MSTTADELETRQAILDAWTRSPRAAGGDMARA
jgi:hypothetical protein